MPLNPTSPATPATVIQYLAIVFDLLARLAWPLTTILLAFAFRKSIVTFLDNIIELKLGAARIKARRPQPPGTGGPPDAPETPRIAAASNDPFLQPVITHLRNSPDLAGLPAEQQVEKLLVNAAQWSVAWYFERIYQLIYGSQIRALQALNSASPSVLEFIRVDYDIAAAVNKQLYDRYPFESWLQFITSWGLVASDATTAGITPLGRQFLQYVAAQGLTLDKPN
jgi:hypothetical protein